MLPRCLLAPAVISSFAVCSYGQDFAPSTPGSSDSRPGLVDRIVVTGSDIPAYGAEDAVTATKTDTPLLDTPQEVTVVPRQVLDDEAVLSLGEALNNVGGVSTGGTFRENDNFTIRGFNSGGFTYLDGLLVDREHNFQEEPFGLERVEVIQGPASVLYGQNPPGGLVNLISKTPQKNNFTNVTVGGGSFSLVETGVDTNSVLNQGGSVYGRVNLLWRQFGSYTDDVDPSERLYFAPSLTIELGKHTTLTLLGQYYHDWVNFGFPLPASGTVLPNPNGRLSRYRNIGEPDHFQNEIDNWRVQLGYLFEHHFNDVFTFRQRTRVGYHSSYTQDITPRDLSDDGRTLERGSDRFTDKYTTVGIDSSLVATFDTGPHVKHTALVGVDFYYIDDIFRGASGDVAPLDLYKPVYGARPVNYEPFSNQWTGSSQTGLYFQEQVTLFDRLSIVGGGRGDFVFTDVHERLDNSGSDASPSAFSPRAGIVYEVVPKQVSAYFSYSQSFLSNPGYRDESGGQVKPEEGEGYEIGAKADLFHGKLSSTVALYQIYRTNVPTADPLNPNAYIVAGEERHRGIDFNTTAMPIKGWNLIAAYGYVDARVTADNGGLVGDRPINVPEHTFNLFTKYTLQGGPLRGLGFGVGYHYQTRQAGDPENTFSSPSYGTLTLAAYYQRGRFSAQVNVNNVTNERYAVGGYNRLYVQEGDPVNVRASVGWKF